jgi:glycerol kinase
MKTHIAALDQGTTSTRCIIVNRAGQITAIAQKEHAQITPQPGHVEHNPLEILQNTREVAAEALIRANLTPNHIAAIGITNQRETTLLWDRRTGQPLHNALVWQDTRTSALVADYTATGGKARFQAQTGLPLASYFSALKLQWLLDTIPDARAKAEAGDALFGTIDTWLAWNLSGHHATDVTNASRTQLMDLKTLDWANNLLAAFRIPRACLPTIIPSSHILAPVTRARELEGIPIAALIGDQHAALIGQVCFSPGEAKNTYGTGNFLLLNTGENPVQSQHGLITTLAYKLGNAPATYALEGSIAVTGALIQWLRDNLGIITNAQEADALAATVPDNGGVTIVPAFSGLYAPYWQENASGLICGLTRYATKAHICRAALEAAAFQTLDVVRAMQEDSQIPLTNLRVDGGMVRSQPLMQFQADILDTTVTRPTITETTALGAAYAAGLATGFWSGPDELQSLWRADREWTPAMAAGARQTLIASWRRAIARSILQ